MKKQTKRALSLRTETVSNLSTDALRNVNGGWTTIVIVPSTNGWTTILSGTLTGTISGGGNSGSGG